MVDRYIILKLGGLGKSATMGIVFANLYVKSKNEGIHCFLVPLRNNNHDVFEGIQIGNCGPKLGNELIDTGFMGFNNYRIKKENLLDRFSSIDNQGNFHSSISNPDHRFSIILGTLLEGRVALIKLSQIATLKSLCIAGRYAALRRQFGEGEGKTEGFIINYQSTLHRLIPALCDSIAYIITSHTIFDKWSIIQPLMINHTDPNIVEFHALLSILKPLSSWSSSKNIQNLREIMGGHGYSKLSIIGGLRNDHDANVTWEGDNHVLMKQTSKFLIQNYQKYLKRKTIEFDSLVYFKDNKNQKIDFKDHDEIQLETLISIHEFRSRKLIEKAFSAIQNENSFECCETYFIQPATKAFGELFVLKTFYNQITLLSCEKTKSVLFNICRIFGLNTLEKDFSVLRENDFISSKGLDQLKVSITKIYEKLKLEIISIIDVISPSNIILRASLGRDDGKNFESYVQDIFNYEGCFQKPIWYQSIKP